MSRKSQRKEDRKLLIEALQSDEFPWDYSYIPRKDRPVEVRREMVKNASVFGRCWIWGRTTFLMDVFKCDAWRIYNQNLDGCREVWKESYRLRKLHRYLYMYRDHQIKPLDPKIVEYERRYREREQAEHDEFNRAQQERYKNGYAQRGEHAPEPCGRLHLQCTEHLGLGNASFVGNCLRRVPDCGHVLAADLRLADAAQNSQRASIQESLQQNQPSSFPRHKYEPVNMGIDSISLPLMARISFSEILSAFRNGEFQATNLSSLWSFGQPESEELDVHSRHRPIPGH